MLKSCSATSTSAGKHEEHKPCLRPLLSLFQGHCCAGVITIHASDKLKSLFKPTAYQFLTVMDSTWPLLKKLELELVFSNTTLVIQKLTIVAAPWCTAGGAGLGIINAENPRCTGLSEEVFCKYCCCEYIYVYIYIYIYIYATSLSNAIVAFCSLQESGGSQPQSIGFGFGSLLNKETGRVFTGLFLLE